MRLYERFADKEFHSSIATTFGIDFDAYENIVLPRLRGAGCRNNIVFADSRMLTHALCGASALPRHAGRLYNVSGVERGGVFHPKLFLQAGRRRGRLIVSSANMTTPGLAGNLELAGTIACDESASGESSSLKPPGHYLLRLCVMGISRAFLHNSIGCSPARPGSAGRPPRQVPSADRWHARRLADHRWHGRDRRALCRSDRRARHPV